MKNGAFRRSLGLALLYIGLFLIIVLVQFSRGPGLSESIGGLSVTAHYPKAAHGKPGIAPETLRLTYAGLSIEISPSSIAQSVAADGSASPLALSSIERLPNGVDVRLAPGVVLRATVDKSAADRFSLAATAPDGVALVRLRLLSALGRLVQKDGRVSLSSGGATYDLGLSAGNLDEDTGLLTLKPGDPGLSLARESPVEQKPQRVAGVEKFVPQAPKDPDIFKAELAVWRDKAWSGLSSTRFDPEKMTWKGGDGTASFSEKALAAYLAESLARGSYSEVLTRVRGARDKWPDKLGFLTAPFLGGLVPKMKAFQASDQAEIKRLEQLVADKSAAVLEKEDVLRFVFDRSPSTLAQDLLRFASGLDPSKLEIRQTIGLLNCVVDAKSLFKDEGNPVRDGTAAADRLVAAVRRSANGYFLTTEDDGSCDLRQSLVAGNCLVAYGTAVSKPLYLGVGQSLVEGVIGLADGQGFVPKRIRVQDGALEDKTGSIAPEDLYSVAAGNPYYPHSVSFGRDLSPGLWAWTCSPSLSVQANASRYMFTADFPEGRSHFLTFYGIKPFANIQLYDIDYNPDNDFESYDASGFLYDRAAGALYLKMKHKKEIEDIKLTF